MSTAALTKPERPAPGDATPAPVTRLHPAAAVATASLLVVTIPGLVESRAVVLHAQQLHSSMPTIARLSDPDFADMFADLQVTNLIYPELEASLEMTRQVLLELGVPVTEIQRQTETMRQAFFSSSISQTRPYRTLTQFRTAEEQFDLQWVRISPTSLLLNSTIGEAEVRKRTGVSVVGILRDEQLEPNPDPHFRFQEKDLVAIIGSREARAAFHNRFFPDEPLLGSLVTEGA